MDTDAIIAEAIAPVEAQPQAETKDAVAETPEAAETEAVEPQADSEGDAKPEEMFPKKAVNALSRRDKQIGKLKAEKQAMLQELEALRQKATPQAQAKDTRPKVEDFEGRPYEDYLDAVTEWKVENKLREKDSKRDSEKKQAEQTDWQEERASVFTESAKEAKKTFSDYKQIVDEYADDFDGLPSHVQDALLDLDNAPFALYMAAKDGLLDKLGETRSATQAAVLLGKLEDKALALSKQKQTTKAPAPIAPAKGGASGVKTVDRMDVKELLAWVRK